MASDLSPTARALLALEVIQNRPGLTGDELAARLGVTDRAARRYVAILREAGIPVDSVTGRYGGYSVGRGARVPPLMFSTAEALGLVVALLRGWHGSIDTDDPAATALGKILRVLPDAAAAPAEALRRVVAQNPSDAAATPDPTLTAEVAHACETHLRLQVAYRSHPGPEYQMVVDPWAVVVRHGRWYLLCWSLTADARRILRIDRIVRAEPIDDAVAPPSGLDPIREVEDHLADGWTHDVEAHISAPVDKIAPCVSRALGRLTPHDEHTCILRGSTDDPTWYAAQLASIPAPFTLIGSDAVRAELHTLADRLNAAVHSSDVSARLTSVVQGCRVMPRRIRFPRGRA
ncbi:MAG TPA: WYL domain-containing protein [Ilumatobacteraceae bacterium]|nr:WYL domain-containing protein [Ilumatobacteraceae bacterium]HRB02073.1 WYL domain-containing protein [Ilumatobacteraceae bacterium]